ncbi:hypothetical protein PIB30_044397 [Stylosanthes scabra]|uniref:GRF-type domain-containing protein n=1 Tax=Stylosanthes scabra TaxID=79078 RepID=A0ABU6XEA3_9FABA|nr:hypothetical protein [Stylosanthes scabra]
MATPTHERGKTSTSSQSCGSACGGSPSFLRKRKKKCAFNNGKCSHGLDAMTLQFGTQLNPGRLFLRCPLWEKADLRCEYFVWVDEIADDEKSAGVHERGEASHNKEEQFMGGDCNSKHLMKIPNKVTEIAEELKYIRKLIRAVCVGVGVIILLLVMCFIKK